MRSVLAAPFSTSSGTPQLSPLAFVPKPLKQYKIGGILLLRTTDIAAGARLGVAWPSGLLDGVAKLSGGPWGTTSIRLAVGNPLTGPMSSLTVDHPDLNSWFGDVIATVISGSAPSGVFAVTLHSEIAGTEVSLQSGSYLEWEAI